MRKGNCYDGVNEAHIFQSADKVSMTFKDETGESSASEIITENGREVSIKISDGRSLTVKTDENGNVISGSLTSADGSYLKTDENGAQFSNTQTGDYIKADKNGAITSAHITYQSGATYDFSDGTGVLVDKENGNKVMWTHDEDGSLVIVSPESNYTVDEKGNLFKDGEPVKFNGSFVNVEKGITPDKEATQSDETDPPQEPIPLDAFLGTWVDSEGSRLILMSSGDTIIAKEPDLSWYGGDVVCTEFRPVYDESSQTLLLKGMTTWVVGPELLDAAVYENRPLELDASTLSMELTAAEVKDGGISKLSDGSQMYTRP